MKREDWGVDGGKHVGAWGWLKWVKYESGAVRSERR